MDYGTLATYVQNTLTLILALSAPVLGVAILIGFLIGLFQALGYSDITLQPALTPPGACCATIRKVRNFAFSPS